MSKEEKADLACASCGKKGRSLGSMIRDDRVADGDGKLRHAKCHRAKYGNKADSQAQDSKPRKTRKQAPKEPAKEPVFRLDQRKLFAITVDVEKPRSHLRYLLEQAIQKELEKKEHDLGEFRIHFREAGRVEEAAWHFAEAIKQSGEDAVNERIR